LKNGYHKQKICSKKLKIATCIAEEIFTFDIPV